MRDVDSQVLGSVARTLGLAGAGAPVTVFEDGILQQVLDVSALVRRGGTISSSTGIYSARLTNIHVGTDTIVTDLCPARPALNSASVAFLSADWPTPVPRSLDVWLLSAFATTAAGSGDLEGGALQLLYGADQMAMGSSRIATNIFLQLYEVEVDIGTIVTFLSFDSAASPPSLLPIRLRPPGVDGNPFIRFTTQKTGGGAATYQLDLLLGLFPAGLGQDVR